MPPTTEDRVLFRFHGDLKQLLRASQGRDGLVAYPLTRRASLKDIIEALGPPHTEIGSIRRGGGDLGFDHIPTEGEAIDVFPLLPGAPFSAPSLLRPEPLTEARFMTDSTVLKLGRLMRMAGLDCSPAPELPLPETALQAADERRVLLSRNRDLLKRSAVTFGRLIRSHHPLPQLAEVIRLFKLAALLRPFSRCMTCNDPLTRVDKSAIEHQLEPLTRLHYHHFKQCPRCGKIYWPGSHHRNMEKTIIMATSAASHQPPEEDSV